MKMHRLFTVVPAALVMNLVFTDANFAKNPPSVINANLRTEPLVLNGNSGGSVASNCGNLPDEPSQVIQVKESLPYLRVTVESEGQPTLLINGPGGRFCIQADSYSGGKAEMSGFWPAGEYSFYIGESSKRQYNYTLSISQQRPSK